MARITLIRHGKTEISSREKHDFDRSLILRGQQNSSAVGVFLREHKMLPQLVLVSSATRTRETYKFMNPVTSYKSLTKSLRNPYKPYDPVDPYHTVPSNKNLPQGFWP